MDDGVEDPSIVLTWSKEEINEHCNTVVFRKGKGLNSYWGYICYEIRQIQLTREMKWIKQMGHFVGENEQQGYIHM